MRKSVFTLALASTVGLAGCMNTQQQNELGGALAGAAIGLVGAKALGANNSLTAAAVVVGASAGAGMAQPKQCTYQYNDGSRTTGPCPQ